MMIITNEEVKHHVTGVSCHGLDDLVRDRGNSQVLDCDSIQRLEVVNKAQRAILFLDTEPAGAVQGVGMLVHAGIDLLLEEFDDVVQDSWGNGEVLVCPWDMLNDWDLNRGEILIAKTSFLFLCPSQRSFIEFENMVHELELLRPEEVVAIEAEIIKALLCEPIARSEVRWMGQKQRKGEERVFWNASDIAKFFRKGGGNRLDFLVDLFVLEDENGQVCRWEWWN